MAEVFMRKVVLEIAQQNPPQLRQAADATIERRVEDAAEKLLDEFENNNVTREIDRGVGSPNVSRTLRGGDASENLFSFIGFDEGDEPTQPIREMLTPGTDDIYFYRHIGKDATRNSIRFQYIAGLEEDKIWEATPLPWAPEMSWAQKIEGKIQGFGSFIARFGAGHSGGGIMAKERGGRGPGLQKLRNADYQKPEGGYLQTMFKRFYARLKGSNIL